MVSRKAAVASLLIRTPDPAVRRIGNSTLLSGSYRKASCTVGTTFNHTRRNDDFFGFGGFGGLGNNGIFTAATVAPIAAGSGIAAPTGVGNGALGNVALFNGGNRGFGGCGNGFGSGFGNRFDDCRPDWFATV